MTYKNSPVHTENLSMRDYFALVALQSLIHKYGYDDAFTAEDAYGVADEMLKAREMPRRQS